MTRNSSVLKGCLLIPLHDTQQTNWFHTSGVPFFMSKSLLEDFFELLKIFHMIFHLSFPSSFDKVVFIIVIFNLWVATIFCLARTHIRTLDFRPHAHRTHVCVLPKFESHTHMHVCVFECAFCQISHTHTHIFPKWKWFFDAIIFFADDSKIILGYSFWSEFQFTGQLDFVFNFSKVK